jgi:hypothetical protein
MERRLGFLGEPYHDGAGGRFSRAAKALTAAGALAILARRPRLGALALLGGAMSTRWAVYKAGFASARDPRYVIGPQRERLSMR